jgi:hypothetical protein
METELTPLLSDLVGYTGVTRRLIAHYSLGVLIVVLFHSSDELAARLSGYE